jgi:hypothetical protein
LVEVAEDFADCVVPGRQFGAAYVAAKTAVTEAESSLDGVFLSASAVLLDAAFARSPYEASNVWHAKTRARSVSRKAVELFPAGEARSRHEQFQCDLLRDIFGDPFSSSSVDAVWLTWNGGTVPKLAQVIYDIRTFERQPILADALEEAGCADAAILGHLRGPGPHVRGCWVLDLLLGKQ